SQITVTATYNGAPVSGAAVTATVTPSSSGSPTAEVPSTLKTNSSGQATFDVVSGTTPGFYTITVSIAATPQRRRLVAERSPSTKPSRNETGLF
ncbi:hypothetical protein ACFFRE_13250, partial [Aciditerrimonas ferrireducens]